MSLGDGWNEPDWKEMLLMWGGFGCLLPCAIIWLAKHYL
jgi:hypothetical protein